MRPVAAIPARPPRPVAPEAPAAEAGAAGFGLALMLAVLAQTPPPPGPAPAERGAGSGAREEPGVPEPGREERPGHGTRPGREAAHGPAAGSEADAPTEPPEASPAGARTRAEAAASDVSSLQPLSRPVRAAQAPGAAPTAFESRPAAEASSPGPRPGLPEGVAIEDWSASEPAGAGASDAASAGTAPPPAASDPGALPPPASAAAATAGPVPAGPGAARLAVPLAALPPQTPVPLAGRTGDQVTLHLRADQGFDGRVRIITRGSAVRAVILPSDPAAAAHIERGLPELRQALAERGFLHARITVQTPAAAETAPASPARGGAAADQSRDGREATSEDARDPAHQRSPRRQGRRHPER